MKIVAIIIFIAIIASLGSALFHLVKNGSEEESRKTAKALTFRIGLSLVLFILLFLAYATGLFKPSGIGSRINQIHTLENNQNQANPQ
jgi:hypothetical protein